MLGEADLLSGIPGEGTLKVEEIKAWIDDPKNHAVLKPTLPLGLAAGAGQIAGVDENPLTRAKIELGRQLYFDPRLSKDGTISCASCHAPEFGYAKNTQFGVGVGGQLGGRNSPVAYNRILSGPQFWDGRAASLEEQAVGPIANPIEMSNTHDACVACLGNVEGYRTQFEKIFPDGVTIDNVAKAIASFERALVTGPAPWDYYEVYKTYSDSYKEDLADPLPLLPAGQHGLGSDRFVLHRVAGGDCGPRQQDRAENRSVPTDHSPVSEHRSLDVRTRFDAGCRRDDGGSEDGRGVVDLGAGLTHTPAVLLDRVRYGWRAEATEATSICASRYFCGVRCRASRRRTASRRAEPGLVEHARERLPLDRHGEPRRDAIEHLGLEHVGPGIDPAGRRLALGRLLDEGDDLPVRRGSAPPRTLTDPRPGQRDRRLGAALGVEREQLIQIQIGQHVAVADEHALVDALRGEADATGGTERLVLDDEPELDVAEAVVGEVLA